MKRTRGPRGGSAGKQIGEGEANMPLDPTQKEKVRRHFRLNEVVPDCPYCGTGGWEPGEIIAGAAVDGRGSVPMVQFVCNNCGHVALFDAKRVGVIA